MTSRRDCHTIVDVGDDYLSPQREVTLGIGCGGLEIPFPWGIPADTVAIIIMHRFVIAPMFAPSTKRLSEMLFHRLRKYPIVNTVAKRIEVELSRNWAGPKTRRGMEYAYVYKKDSNWLVSPGSAGSPI